MCNIILVHFIRLYNCTSPFTIRNDNLNLARNCHLKISSYLPCVSSCRFFVGLINRMACYAVFVIILVISRRQLTYLCISWIPPVLRYGSDCLKDAPMRIPTGTTPSEAVNQGLPGKLY